MPASSPAARASPRCNGSASCVAWGRIRSGWRAWFRCSGRRRRARGFGPEALRPLPFLYVFGRSDAVIIHSANVYTDHLAHVLEQSELQAAATGNFRLGASTDPDGRGVLHVDVELRRGVVATEELRALYQQGILQGL